MWDFIGQSGVASTVVDFTDELSLLLIGLVSLVWLSAGMIVCAAVRHYLSQKKKPVVGEADVSPDRQEAA